MAKPKTPSPKELLNLRQVFSDCKTEDDGFVHSLWYFEIYHREKDDTYWSVYYKIETVNYNDHRGTVVQNLLLRGVSRINQISSVDDELLLYALMDAGCSIKLPGAWHNSIFTLMNKTDKKKAASLVRKSLKIVGLKPVPMKEYK